MIKYDWPRVVRTKEPVIIYVFADTHFGNPGVNKELLKRHIQMVKDEGAGWIHLGDWVESIGPKDRRFDIRTATPIIEQYQEAFEYFEPIASQNICVLSGNHDETNSKNYGDEVSRLARDLGMPYLGYSGFVHLKLYTKPPSLEQRYNPTKTYTLFLHHGHGMGFLVGAKTINMQRLSHKWNADVYLIGHIHTYLSHIDRVQSIRTHGMKWPTLINKHRYYASAPSYFDSYRESIIANYAEMKAMYPQPCGCLRMEINQRQHRNELGKMHYEWTLKIEPLLGEER